MNIGDLKKAIFRPATGIILVAIFISYLLISPQSKNDSEVKTEVSWKVKVQDLTLGSYQPIAKLHAEVTSFRKATLRSALEADVEKVWIRDGQSVNKGQLLVLLEKDKFELTVKERLAEIKKLKANIESEKVENAIDKETINQDKKLMDLSMKMRERYRKLQARNHSSQSQVEEAEKSYLTNLISLKKTELKLKSHQLKIDSLNADLAKVQAQLEKAKIDLADTEVKAPFDGLIIDVLIAKGDRLTKNTAMIRLFSEDSIELRANLTEDLRQTLQKALSQKQLILAKIDNKIPAKLERIDSSIDQGDSNVDAFFTVNKDNAKHLPLGMTKRIVVTLPKLEKTYLIPQSSLHHGDTIFIIQQQRLKGVKVKRLGYSLKNNQNYYVIRPVKPFPQKVQVVITKLPFMRSGIKVKVI